MSFDSIRSGSMSSPHLQISDFQKKTRTIKQTNVDIYATDFKLKKRVREFEAADSGVMYCKIAAVCLLVIPILGWIASYTLWAKASVYEGKKNDMMNDLISQIGKDTNRRFVISVNSEPFNNPISLKRALDRQGLSDVQKYKILQLSHQGIYATLLKATMFPLISWGNQNAPVFQKEGESLAIYPKGHGQGNYRDYFPKDITLEQGKSIDIRISGWKKTPLISSKIRNGLGVYDETAPLPHQQRVIFEMDIHFTINAKTGKMNIYPHLDKINPLTGPVTLYDSNTESVQEKPATTTSENSQIFTKSSGDEEATTRSISPPSPEIAPNLVNTVSG